MDGKACKCGISVTSEGRKSTVLNYESLESSDASGKLQCCQLIVSEDVQFL